MPYFETIHDRIAFIRATEIATFCPAAAPCHDAASDARGSTQTAAIQSPATGGFPPAAIQSPAAGDFSPAADRNRLQSADFQVLLYVYDHRGIAWSKSPQGTRITERPLPRKGWYHRHEYVEILYVIEGSFDQLLLGERCRFPQGAFVITDQNCAHSDYLEAIDAAVLFLQIRPEYLDELLRSYPQTDELHRFLLHTLYQQKTEQSFLELSRTQAPSLGQSGEDSRALELSRLLEQIVREDLSRLPGSEHVRRGLLIRLLQSLCTDYAPVLHSSSRESREKAFLYELERYIRLHDADVTLHSLEQVFHYHRNYFSLILQKYRGQTFRKYVQNVRLDHALQLLAETALPVRQIAAAVGYENTSHFYHLFEQRFGMPPKKVRELHAPAPAGSSCDP